MSVLSVQGKRIKMISPENLRICCFTTTNVLFNPLCVCIFFSFVSDFRFYRWTLLIRFHHEEYFLKFQRISFPSKVSPEAASGRNHTFVFVERVPSNRDVFFIFIFVKRCSCIHWLTLGFKSAWIIFPEDGVFELFQSHRQLDPNPQKGEKERLFCM